LLKAAEARGLADPKWIVSEDETLFVNSFNDLPEYLEPIAAELDVADGAPDVRGPRACGIARHV